MTDPTLFQYIDSAAADILSELPLQSFSTASLLVYAYISNVGGWVADNPSDPQGPGHLLNGFTPPQAAAAITAQQVNAVYDLNFTISIDVNVQAIVQLTDGLSLSTAAADMASQVSNFITNTINGSPLPINVASVSSQTPNSGFSLLGGNTTQSVRQQIANLITSEDVKLIDYKSIALLYVQDTYGVDDTWNVVTVYVQSSNPIVVMIEKYTNSTYATLDNTSTTIYVISISPTTYQVIAGVIVE